MEALGLDFKIILFQAVNFLLLMIVLGKILYKPILGLLEDRKRSIVQAGKEAEKIKFELALIKEEQKRIINEAHLESRLIFEKESQKAKEHYQEMTKRTKDEVAEMLLDGERKLTVQKENFLENSRKEMTSLIGLLVEKSLNDCLTDPEKERVVEESLKRIS